MWNQNGKETNLLQFIHILWLFDGYLHHVQNPSHEVSAEDGTVLRGVNTSHFSLGVFKLKGLAETCSYGPCELWRQSEGVSGPEAMVFLQLWWSDLWTESGKHSSCSPSAWNSTITVQLDTPSPWPGTSPALRRCFFSSDSCTTPRTPP